MEHGENVFYTTVLTLSFLLFVASAVAVIIKRLHVPYTVVLSAIGIALAAISHLDSFAFLNVLELSPDLVFYFFLPMLIFEGAYNIRFIEMRSSMKAISALAVGSLVVSTFFIGYALYWTLPYAGIHIPLITLLLFGALISATDPIAALAIFKEVGVPKRLRMLLEGESLLNDGTALALFQVILGIAAAGAMTSAIVIGGFMQFWILVLGGALFGAFMGYIFAKAIEKIHNLAVVEITLTLILAHTTFIFAEKFLSVSGIIATTAAAMVIGNYGRYKISPKVREFMEHFWEYAAFLANSLIFLLIGLSVRGAEFSEYIVPISLALAAVLVARFLSIYGVVPFVNTFTKEEYTPFSWQFILSWGGLRGALPLAIVLLLPENIPGVSEHKEFLLILTLSTIFFTLLIKAATIKPFLRYLKLQSFSPAEQMRREESFLIMDIKVQDRLNEMLARKDITQKTHDRLSAMYTELYTQSKQRLTDLLANRKTQLSPEEMLFELRAWALGIEKRVYLELFERYELSEETFALLSHKIERQMERIERRMPQVKDDGRTVPVLTRLKRYLVSEIGRSQIPFIRRWHETLLLREKIQKYCLHRARKISSETVLVELEEMRREMENAAYQEAARTVLEQYRAWQSDNINKMNTTKQAVPELVDMIEYTIANLVSLNFEIDTLKEMRAKGIVPDNVYADVIEYYERLHLEKENKLLHYRKSV